MKSFFYVLQKTLNYHSSIYYNAFFFIANIVVCGSSNRIPSRDPTHTTPLDDIYLYSLEV